MHAIPNLLTTPDLFLFGLTVRQGLLLLIGGGTGYLLFLRVFALFANPSMALLAGLCAALLCLSGTLTLVFLQRGRRVLEEWGLVLLLYAARPRVYSWRLGPQSQAWRRSVPAPGLGSAWAGDQPW